MVFGACIWVREIWSSGVSLKRYCKIQFSRVDFRSMGPPSQKLSPNLICLIPHCNYKRRWGGVSSKRSIHIWENAFSDNSFYWPMDLESILSILHFKKKCFRETVLCTLYILDRVQISKTCRFLQYFGENSPLQGGKRDFALIHSNPRYACLSTPCPHCSHTRSKGGALDFVGIA